MILRILATAAALIPAVTATSILYAQETAAEHPIVRTNWLRLQACESEGMDELLLSRTYEDGAKEYAVMWSLCGANCYRRTQWVGSPEKAKELAEKGREEAAALVNPDPAPAVEPSEKALQ